MATAFANAWVYKLIPNLEPSRKAEKNLKRINYEVSLKRELLGTFSKHLIIELYKFESTCFITQKG